ncbi:unnamed protein product [Callosobruchus maculatus]|uniref:Protein sleepless n=1 Tax=Callosobruchus maculatus TaxID=64391 RepID=A0A653BZ94_CALMS|nr:unnamed protein product [Callosobruchus maculatus]
MMTSVVSIVVLLASFLVTFDHVECGKKCFACTSWETDCSGLQNAKTSPSIDCERYGGPCAELHFHHNSIKPVTIRFCLPMKELPNCDVIQRRVTDELKGWKMTNCTTCETDFCNGNSFV